MTLPARTSGAWSSGFAPGRSRRRSGRAPRPRRGNHVLRPQQVAARRWRTGMLLTSRQCPRVPTFVRCRDAASRAATLWVTSKGNHQVNHRAVDGHRLNRYGDEALRAPKRAQLVRETVVPSPRRPRSGSSIVAKSERNPSPRGPGELRNGRPVPSRKRWRPSCADDGQRGGAHERRGGSRSACADEGGPRPAANGPIPVTLTETTNATRLPQSLARNSFNRGEIPPARFS